MTFDEYWTAEMRAVGATNYKRESLFYALAKRAWDAAWKAAKKSEQAAWHAGLDAGREQGRSKDHIQQPPSAPVGVEGLMQLARNWCLTWGEWAHDADPGGAKENAAETALRAALTTALAQQPAAVDEAMVERATMTLLGKSHDTAPGIDWRCERAWTVNKVRKNMHAALTAALAAQPGGNGDE